MGYQLNGVESESLPVHIVKIFTDAYPVRKYVETGTAGGASIAVASKLFDKCYTIELIEGRVVEKNLPNVEYHTGDSVAILPSIFSNFVGEYAFVFLDAHYSDPTPNTSGYKECPLIDEIKACSISQKNIICIDDARLFFGHPPFPNDPREWPMLEEIFAAAKQYFPNHHTTITDDFILIYPDEMGSAVIAAWTKRFSIRYPSAADKLQTEVKSVYNSFKKYVGI
jgi:hypothetical protein